MSKRLLYLLLLVFVLVGSVATAGTAQAGWVQIKIHGSGSITYNGAAVNSGDWIPTPTSLGYTPANGYVYTKSTYADQGTNPQTFMADPWSTRYGGLNNNWGPSGDDWGVCDIYFEPRVITIQTSVDGPSFGTVSPQGTISLTLGQSRYYTLKAAPGYLVEKNWWDNQWYTHNLKDISRTFTYAELAADHSTDNHVMKIAFKADPNVFTINNNVAGSGSLNLQYDAGNYKQFVPKNTPYTWEANAASGYYFSHWTEPGSDQRYYPDDYEGNFCNAARTHCSGTHPGGSVSTEVTWHFLPNGPKTLLITYDSDKVESSHAGMQTLNFGDSLNYSFTSKRGYKVKRWIWNGKSYDADDPYSGSNTLSYFRLDTGVNTMDIVSVMDTEYSIFHNHIKGVGAASVSNEANPSLMEELPGTLIRPGNTFVRTAMTAGQGYHFSHWEWDGWRNETLHKSGTTLDNSTFDALREQYCDHSLKNCDYPAGSTPDGMTPGEWDVDWIFKADPVINVIIEGPGTVTGPDGQVLSSSGTITVPYRSKPTLYFNSTVNGRYYVEVNGTSKGQIDSYPFNSEFVDDTTTVKAVFSEVPTTYTITVIQPEGGYIEPAGPVVVEAGTSAQFTFVPDSDCIEAQSALWNGAPDSNLVLVDNATIYNTPAVNGNSTLSGNFVQKTTVVTVVPTTGGTTYPSGEFEVPCGSTNTLVVVADPCYELIGFKLGNSTIRFADPVVGTSNHTYKVVHPTFRIKPLFQRIKYDVTYANPEGGTIDVLGLTNGTVSCGGTLTIETEQESSCYLFESLKVNGAIVAAASEGGNRTGAVVNIEDVHEDLVIEAFYTLQTGQVTATADFGAIITPSGVINTCGGPAAFTIAPYNASFVVTDVLVNNSSIGVVPGYTFNSTLGQNTIHVAALESGFTLYEDAEDGTVNGWDIYDAENEDSTSGLVPNMANVKDNCRDTRVIEFSGSDGTKAGYRLRLDDHSEWNNRGQFILEWSMRSEGYVIYIDVEDTEGEHAYISYIASDQPGLIETKEGHVLYYRYGLGSDSDDGKWRTFRRDLEEEFATATGGNRTLAAVHGFLIRGNGAVDNIKLWNLIPPAYDTDSDGLADKAELEQFFTDPNRPDTDMDGRADGDEVDAGTDPLLRDTDGDTFADGEEHMYGTDPLDAASKPAGVVYEDAEDGTTDGWMVAGDDPDGTFANIKDPCRDSRVIEFNGTMASTFVVQATNDTLEQIGNRSIFQFSVRSAQRFAVIAEVAASDGRTLMLKYVARENGTVEAGDTYMFSLTDSAWDGAWHDWTRDLQRDLNSVAPMTTVTKVLGVRVMGNGRIDNIRLMDAVPAGLDSDLDGLTDTDELEWHSTNPYKPDTDGDWLTDFEEVHSNSTDALVWDTDGDGFSDGLESEYATDPSDPASYPSRVVYEDAEDGLISRWNIQDNDPTNATVFNEMDDLLGSRVIRTQGVRLLNKYRLGDKMNEDWRNTKLFTLQWSMFGEENRALNLYVTTDQGERIVKYWSDGITGENATSGVVRVHSVDGEWQTFTRDVEQDLAVTYPGETLISLDSAVFQGTCKVDDVEVLETYPMDLDTDGDGLSDWSELYEHNNTDPFNEDSDADGLSDYDEINLHYTNPLMEDTDGDGFEDGFEVERGTLPADASSVPAHTVYEDGEDGAVDGWDVYTESGGNTGTVQNLADGKRGSRVIVLTADNAIASGFRLRDADGTYWGNTEQFVLRWSMRTDAYVIYVLVRTDAGTRYLSYIASPEEGFIGLTGSQNNYARFGLGPNPEEDVWRTFTRDLAAETWEAFGETLQRVEGFLIRGSSRVDDVMLIQ